RDRRRHLPRVVVVGAGPGRRRLLCADVPGHRRVPPLLLAPRVQDLARVPAGPGPGRAERGTEGGALVVRPSPLAPQALGYAARRPLGPPAGLLVLARRVDPGRPVERDRPRHGPRPGEVPRAPFPEPPLHPALARGRAGRRLLPPGWRAWAGLGLLRLDGDAVARVVHDQLAVAHVRPPPLPDHRRLAQQLAAGAADHRRGVAQQPPPLSKLGQPGLLLVGGRRDLL